MIDGFISEETVGTLKAYGYSVIEADTLRWYGK